MCRVEWEYCWCLGLTGIICSNKASDGTEIRPSYNIPYSVSDFVICSFYNFKSSKRCQTIRRLLSRNINPSVINRISILQIERKNFRAVNTVRKYVLNIALSWVIINYQRSLRWILRFDREQIFNQFTRRSSFSVRNK
jgi:hypothetical protein